MELDSLLKNIAKLDAKFVKQQKEVTANMAKVLKANKQIEKLVAKKLSPQLKKHFKEIIRK